MAAPGAHGMGVVVARFHGARPGPSVVGLGTGVLSCRLGQRGVACSPMPVVRIKQRKG